MYDRIIIIFCYMIFIFFLFSCTDSKQPTEVNQESIIKGFLKVDNLPVVNADVEIDDVLNWRTVSDSNGYFQIMNCTSGEHILKCSKSKENGQVLSIESSILVNEGETNLGDILLPVPPLFYEIDTSEVSQNKLKLSWSHSTDNDYREYKLYRKSDPGIDETTGELIYVTTEKNDTVFVDGTFISGIMYFYRVYTLSAYGKLGGSNVVFTNTPKINLILNGGFETPENNSIPEWYSYTNIFSLDSIIVYNGKYSVIADKPSGEFGDWDLNQDISGSRFVTGNTYKFSVMMKSENTPMGAFVFYYNNGNMNLLVNNLRHPEGSDWGEESAEFQMPPYVSSVTVRLWVQKDNTNEELKAWFDDVKIELVQGN